MLLVGHNLIAAYSVDLFGRDVISGYGCKHIPTMAGSYEMKINLFKPRSSSLMQSLYAWFLGEPPEYADPRMPSYSQGREVTRVSSGGYVVVKLHVVNKDMQQFGYDDGSQSRCGIVEL
eukprot:TRINITY_DN45203_c0_g1_i1.p3 TRINITY_DN45203_c0_g1~~TRINITY_DN45203_c0_g1_i1.p3  ORF type:complete len:119 (-),score=13.74 TRINITY_DN45203_c0_g1_i1:65-421(-)